MFCFYLGGMLRNLNAEAVERAEASTGLLKIEMTILEHSASYDNFPRW